MTSRAQLHHDFLAAKETSAAVAPWACAVYARSEAGCYAQAGALQTGAGLDNLATLSLPAALGVANSNFLDRSHSTLSRYLT
jgi:hypothetical protein